MKKNMKRLFALVTTLAILMAGALPVSADSDKPGNGYYDVIISNDTNTTGVSIEGDLFHAYQIFIADNVTSFSVAEAFRDFFAGTLTGDDGTEYNFQHYLSVINTYEDPDNFGSILSTYIDNEDIAAFDTALNSYNQLAGAYMDSYENNMYTLSVQVRTYLDTYGSYVDGVTDGIECMAHAYAAEKDANGYEYATLEGLDSGYYFIFDQESTANGIGVSASGAFVPLTEDSNQTTTIEVKESIPTMTKTIYHDDTGAWDIVGDSQIGDTVNFRVISTMPANIEDYTDTANNSSAINKYDYILSDIMSEGLTYNGDVKVYTDADKTNEVDADTYLDIDTSVDPINDGYTFKVTVDVIELLDDDDTIGTLYFFYSATLNEDAVAYDADTNTAELEYSTNPSDATDTDTTDSTVTHFTFALTVNKVDEYGVGLAGARFGLFDSDGNAIPLSFVETINDVDYYAYDKDATYVSDGGYITTTAAGKFVINGLNDQIAYTLREVEAPNGYNAADPFSLLYTVYYDSTGNIIDITDGSASVYTDTDDGGNWYSSSTIINRLKIYLPTTGGMGTVLFQVGGGVLMLGAIAVLVTGQRKKKEDTPE